MERLQFVDANLHQVPGDVFDNSCYAIDLGICSSFARRNLPGEYLHHFVSALPWVKGVDRKYARVYLKTLSQLNPNVKFGLLELEQVDELNLMGISQGFKIDNCWTCSTSYNGGGHVYGYYSLTDGREVIDWGKNRTDVYFVFGFVPGHEHPIVAPR